MVELDEPQKTLAWSNTVSIILTAIVSAGLTYYFMSPGAGGLPSVGIGGIFIDLLRYLPHSLLLFGVLADMLTYEGVYSIPSLVGFLSIFVNKLLQFFWDGLYALFMASGSAPAQTVATGNVGCEIAGFEFVASSYVPQTLVVTATVFFYYALDLITNRGWVDATATIVLLGVLFIGQVAVMDPCNKMGLGKGLQAALAIIEGLLIGGFSLGVVTNYYPERLPSAVLPQYPRKSAKDLKPGPNGTMVDDEGRPWTILANGAIIPDTSTPEGRAAFQSTGAPAQATNCPS